MNTDTFNVDAFEAFRSPIGVERDREYVLDAIRALPRDFLDTKSKTPIHALRIFPDGVSFTLDDTLDRCSPQMPEDATIIYQGPNVVDTLQLLIFRYQHTDYHFSFRPRQNDG